MQTATSQVVSQLQRSIARAIYGKEDVIQLALITLLARGHLLIEDVPGVGKTTWRRPWPAPSIARFNAYNSPATFCPATCWE